MNTNLELKLSNKEDKATIKKLSIKTRRKLLGYVFLIPTLLFLGTFIIYPIIKSVIMSFTDWNGFNENVKLVGFQNYINTFQNAEYWNGIGINLKLAFISTALQTVLGFLLAFMLYHMTKKAQEFFKVTLYIPVVIPVAVVVIMFTFFLSPQNGLVNQILTSLGLENLTRAWLGDRQTALGSIILVNTWQYVGFSMVLYYVSMMEISKEVLESADVDGATKFKKLIYFFLPLTKGATETNLILSLVGGMKSFALFYLMTGGGPGISTQVAPMVIYNTAFSNYKYSNALSMSVVLFMIIMIFTVIIRKAFSDKE